MRMMMRMRDAVDVMHMGMDSYKSMVTGECYSEDDGDDDDIMMVMMIVEIER